MEDKTIPIDEQIVAAVHKACGLGRISLTHINNDGEEVPTDVARCFARAIDALRPVPSPIICEDCGDVCTAHDPGVCGNCYAMKYSAATSIGKAMSEVPDVKD